MIIAFKMKKTDLNSLKAMFYPMNVFNERNICGFFPLSHTIIINLIINFLLIIQFNLNALQIIEYNFHYLYIPDLTVNATVYNLHYHVMSKDLSVCKPDVDVI